MSNIRDDDGPPEFIDGYRAFEAGQPISACPYDDGTAWSHCTIEYLLWRDGWMYGNRKKEGGGE